MHTQIPGGALHRLKDSGLELSDAKADVRGRQVIDRSGEEIGKVDDLLIDEKERKVRFLEVGSGGFLGLGETRFLLPVEAVTRIDTERVHVNQSRQRVAGAPRYDPELTEPRYLDQVYGYYGYRTPFWDAAYVYPRYPYF